MAGPNNSTSSYDDKAIRESLLDIITNIDPTEDFLYRTLQKSKADAPYHQWLTDTLKAVATNAQIEGADASYAARTNPVRVGNFTQIVSIPFSVSGTDRAANTAGFKDRYQYELKKAMKEWRHDAEFALLRGSVATGTGTGARQMAGVKSQITTLATAQSGVSLSETMLNSFLENAWNEGGQVDTLLVGGTLKRRISGFGSNTRNINASAKSVVVPVDTYESDFGRVEVLKHRLVTVSGDTNNDLLGIEKGKWAVAHLRDPHVEELAKVGDSDRAQVIGELTLEGRAENANFKATALL